ncbi:putative ubiquitin hydrolase [Trypanosoma cruzi]|nr:putative ubiquitin hydrolase [Trypanosoma cruzi]
MLEADDWVTRLPVSPNSERGADDPSASLSADVLFSAYRLGTPCVCRHTTARNRVVNCVASPRCFAGFLELATDASVLNECVADIMGEGPPLLPAKEDDTALEDTLNKLTCAKSHLLRRGITNLGNTCYLNAILQLLFNIPSVRYEVFSACTEDLSVEEHRVYEICEDSVQKPDDAERGEDEGSQPIKYALQASGLGELFAEMALTRDGNGANAQPFAAFLSLDTKTQQDAQEFFALLISWLQHHGGEVVERTFEGTLLYDRRCSNCHRVFKRAEPFFFLSLPVKGTVEEALSTFLQPEEVEGFMCDGCNLTTTASSCQYLRTLPDVLVVHLNRFAFDLQTLQREKVTTSVSFPLEWELTDYINRWQQQQQQQRNEENDSATDGAANITATTNTAATTTTNCSKACYTLMGVVNHIGETALSGHYTFHGKVDEEAGWYLFDDAKVTKLHHRLHGNRIISKEAYMLVYQLRPCESTTALHDDMIRASEDLKNERGNFVPLPPRLLKHVQQLNRELEIRRQDWEMRRADFLFFLQQWGEIALNLLGGRLLCNSVTVETAAREEEEEEDEGERSSTELADLFAVPSSWLRLFGRGFLPSYVDVRQYNECEKRKKRLRRNASSRTGLEDMMGGDPPNSSSLVGNETCDNARGATSTEQLDDDATATRINGGGGCVDMANENNILFEGTSWALLLDLMEGLRCPHGKLAPWAPYKLVPSALSARLASLLNTMPTLRGTFPVAEEMSSSHVGWRVRDYACAVCTRAMAAEVLRLKKSWDEERAALALLSGARDALKSKCHGNQADTINQTNIYCEEMRSEGEAAAAGRTVYVSKALIEFWEESLAANAKRKGVVNRQGFTGLFAALRMEEAADRNESNDNNNNNNNNNNSKNNNWHDNVSRFTLPECGRLLCDHRLLAPSAAVQVVPAATWRYLRERVAQPLCAGENTSEVLDNFLPYLPTESTLRCPDCIQNTVSLTAQRHHAKMSKIAESKRFPTLASAAQFLSMPQAEMRKQHPNSYVWKRNLERLYRDHYRSWEKEQAAVVAAAETQIATLTREEEERKKAEAAWESMRVRRGGQKKRFKQTNSSTETRTAPQVTPSMSVATPLQQAEEALKKARAATCPDLCYTYGCIPMWWVTLWRRWFMDLDGTFSLPPFFDYEALLCPHGGTLVAPHLLNPADPFWEAKSVARHLVRLWHQRSSAISIDDACDVYSLDDDNKLPPFPPLLLLPLTEFIEIIETYGKSGMLLPPSPSSGEKNTELIRCRVNSSKTILFVERNTDRVFDPPTCEECVASLLEGIRESSRYFLNGSLRLQLRFRRSRKNFYESTDVLRELHHTTTLRELKQAISRLVAEHHGFLLPLQEMELLRGRKPLRRHRNHTMKKNESEAQPSGSGNVASPLVIDTNEMPTSLQGDEDAGTLFDYGLCDGDVLTVNATERVLEKIAGAMKETEVWEEVPAELLQPVQESSTAFGATRLHGAVGKSRRSGAAEANAQVACGVCTFINAPGRVRCDMCETPFKQ